MKKIQSESPGFRVIIVGGSISGLTLALALERADIDFVVLEAYHDIAPQVGASVGLVCNGSRVIDQLGLYDDVLKHVAPMQFSN
jgi:2-polyprenyl-6-methoxyphenol hydroxylase-like FAD-dependent oxidoreductase